jgi:hypothetical protein
MATLDLPAGRSGPTRTAPEPGVLRQGLDADLRLDLGPLSAELAHGLLMGDTKPAYKQELPTNHRNFQEQRALRFEMVSVKGLFFENNDAIQKAQLHVVFRGQVLRSEEVAVSSLTSSDIIFNFTADFCSNDLNFGDISSLHDIDCPVMIFLTTCSIITSNAVNGSEDAPVGMSSSKSLRALALLDCRLVFVHTASYMSIELMPCEADGFDAGGFSAGVLYLRISVLENSILQSPGNGDVDSDSANDIIRRYQSNLSLASNENYQRAKTWWLSIRKDCPWVDSRDIKMVAHDECGQQRFVCAFVGPISPLREVNNPREAARMVSLIPFVRNIGIAGGRVNKWKSPLALLSCMHGDIEDHSILLCSLLLGWGMDAWVAMGSIVVPAQHGEMESGNREVHAKKPHCWVVTLDRLSDHRVVFWESLTGQQYDIELDATRKGRFIKCAELPINTTTSAHGAVVSSKSHDKHPFIEIFALFRHDEYLLNIQRDPCVSAINGNSVLRSTAETSRLAGVVQSASFDILDHKYWVKFPFLSGNLLRHPGSNLFLSSSPFQTGSSEILSLEIRIEKAITDFITQSRRDIGLQTKHDSRISAALNPAIISYELDRAQGVTSAHGAAEFQCSVRKLVTRGECFKAYPTCFSHAHIPSVVATLAKTSVARDIICARSVPTVVHGGDLLGMNSITRHGIRAKVFIYPEGLCSLWLMIAVCYFENKSV